MNRCLHFALAALATPLLFAASVNPTPFEPLTDLTGKDPSRAYSPQSWNDGAGQPVSVLFDGKYNNRASRSGGAYDVVYTLETPKAVNACRITIHNSPDRVPKDWTFRGSNDFDGTNFDSATWTDIHSESNEVGWVNYEQRLYVFANTNAYSTYSLHVTANVNGNNVQWDELDLYYLETPVQVTGYPGEFGPTEYGTSKRVVGAEVTFSTFSGNWESPSGTESSRCTGYKVYQFNKNSEWELWLSGETNTVTFAVPGNSTKVEWQYEATVKIAVATVEHGSVTGTGWYAAGETCTLTPVPDEGYEFVAWTGDHGSIGYKQTTFMVTEALSLTPMFVLSSQRQRYVSPNGSDSDTGLSTDHPFATITNAIASLGELGGRVYLMDGTYSGTGMAITGCEVNAPVTIAGLSGDSSKVVVVAPKDGRTFRMTHPEAVLRDLTIKGCGYTTAGTVTEGTTVYMTNGAVEDCAFTGTFGRHYASKGTLYMTGGRVSRCVFTNCYMRIAGLGVYATGGLIEDSLICNNNRSSNNPGTFAADLSGTAVMLNCTITDNHMDTDAGVKVSSADCRVVNCIISGNTSINSATAHVYGGTSSYYKNFIGCVTEIEIPGSTDCTVGGVVFKDVPSKNFRLMPSSSGFDSGVEASAYAVSTTDLDGLPRIVGSKIDVGCYENQQNEFTCAFVGTIDRKITPVTADFTATVLCAPAGDIEYVWNFGDGTEETYVNVNTVRHIYEVGGTYDVTLTTRAGGESAVKTETAFFKVSAPVTYVSAGNANEAAPYDTEETAASTFAKAVAFAEDGGEVVLLPGLYRQGSTLTIDKALTVRGKTGNPDDVVITNTVHNSSVRVLVMHHAEAKVSGVTLTNGRTNGNNLHGATLFFNNFGGTVSNCVIRSGQTAGWASWAGAVAMNKGLLTHCVITGVFSTTPQFDGTATYTGQIVYLNGDQVRMENCLIRDVSALVKSDGGNITSCVGPLVSVAKGRMANCTLAVDFVHRAEWPTTVTFDGGSAIYCGKNGSVVNCVATGFRRGDGTTVPFGGVGTFTTCAGDAEVAGISSLVGTPAQFYAAPAAGNYRPLPNGLLIHAGSSVDLSSATDLLGKPRVVGRGIDIGCYERQSIGAFVYIQ